MAVTILTPKAVANFKPRSTAFYVVDKTKLELRVAPDGSKSWSVRYTINRHQRRLTLGDAAVLTLANARKMARDARKQVLNNVDPAAEKIARRDAESVEQFAKTFITKHAKPKKRSWRADQRMLKRQVLPSWEHRLMRDITRRDVRVLLDNIIDRGAPVVANRVHSLLSKFFAFAIQEDVVETNVVRDLPKPSQEHIRERVLSDDELRTFWQTTETFAPALQALWRIRLLTAKRPGEVARMKWEDVDLDAGWWTSPASSEKNNIAHRVPLSTPVVKMLTDLRGTQTTGYVFAGIRGKKQHAVTFPLENFQPKDLRKTVATLLSKHGIADATIDAVLNHKKKGIIKTYNLYQYDTEKRIALDTWARTLTAILEQKPASVLTFARS